MSLLECPVRKEDWADKLPQRNGVSAAAKPMGGKPVADAGRWEPAVQKIVEFQHLGDDWDGLGAVAPSHELLACAIGLAYLFSENGLPPPNCVVPGLDGSVNFEWQDPDGTIAEVEIDRPLHAEVMVIRPEQPATHWTLPTP